MKKEVVAYKRPNETIAYTFQKLGTNLEYMNSSKNFKTLLITSSKSGEGKSMVSANLAVTYAKQGNRVVLIDADLRQGRQHSIFGVLQQPGFSNYLSGVSTNKLSDKITEIERCIQETDVDNLFVISTGHVPPNPVELLMSSRLDDMIEELKKEFDIIIFDGTPSSLVKDAFILATKVDTVAIVTASNRIRKSELEEVISNIKQVGGHISGIILNRTKRKHRTEDSYYSSIEDFDIQEYSKKVEKEKSEKKKEEVEEKKPVTRRKRTTTTKKTTKVKEETKKKKGKREMNKISKERTNDLVEQINNFVIKED